MMLKRIVEQLEIANHLKYVEMQMLLAAERSDKNYLSAQDRELMNDYLNRIGNMMAEKEIKE
jgi:hypothetical protein